MKTMENWNGSKAETHRILDAVAFVIRKRRFNADVTDKQFYQALTEALARKVVIAEIEDMMASILQEEAA